MEKMKIHKISLLAAVLATVSCSKMDEMDPEGFAITADQVTEAVTAIPDRADADLAGVYAFTTKAMSTYNNGSIHNDFGYPAVCMFQDCNGPDMVCDNSNYNWFTSSYDYTDRNDNYIVCYIRYSYFYNQIALCNAVLKGFEGVDMETASAEQRHSVGQALAVRAFDYLGLAPYYAFRYQDSRNDECVPILDINTNYMENPRATVEAIYDIIIGDLTKAIDYLADYSRPDKTRMDQNVAYGLRARAYLNMGMFKEAAEDAQRALEGYTPYTIDEVSTPAFCDINDHSWIWGSLIESDDAAGFASWPSHLCSFTGSGYTAISGMYKRISSMLYDLIPSTDVRKGWWVNESLDSPLLSTIEWNGRKGRAISTMTIPNVKVAFKEYTTVKFGQKQGIGSTDNASDWCIMRAEEMILIRAEGLAMSGQESTAKQVLEDFIRTYRDPSYTCEAASAEDLQDEIWKQRRIELWGEGFSMSDIMRLAKPVVRTHGSSTMTNWPAAFAFNIAPDDPYLLLRFPQRETNSNKAIPASSNKAGTPPVSGDGSDLRDGVTD